MKTRAIFAVLVLFGLALALTVSAGRAQGPSPQGDLGVQALLGTAFTYQGQLKKDGSPVSGNCDFQFSLWDAGDGGTQIGTTLTRTNVLLSNGFFTIPDLDFGSGAFQGEARWLEIAVRCAGDTNYTPLTPRQTLTPAPYALALPGLWTQQNATSPNLIGGYSGNSVAAGVMGATVGGGGASGFVNRVTDNYGTVGGGASNQAGNYAVVAGGWANSAGGRYAAVSGGYGNAAGSDYAAVGGGQTNTAGGDYATVGGGWFNAATAAFATIAGGGPSDPLFPSNTNNRVTDNYGVVGGGGGNRAGDGDDNPTNANYATVGGGRGNTAGGQYATVGGGSYNTASGGVSTVGGGEGNTASGANATIGGGYQNAAGSGATVGGGGINTASGSYATVGGGTQNTASGEHATIGGGTQNTASGEHATIGGGTQNTASGQWATVGGGRSNTADHFATVGGGEGNNAGGGNFATVGGGYQNTAHSVAATVGGGYLNIADSTRATVGGGAFNTASGEYATVPGGHGAAATHYGEMAYASGVFALRGDAQTSLYVMRIERTCESGMWYDLYLNGNDTPSQFLTVASGRTFAFEALVVGRTEAGESAGYYIRGVVENVGGTVGFIGTPVVTTLGEDDTAWNVQTVASDTYDALFIQVQGNGEIIRWVATVRTAEVSW